MAKGNESEQPEKEEENEKIVPGREGERFRKVMVNNVERSKIGWMKGPLS